MGIKRNVLLVLIAAAVMAQSVATSKTADKVRSDEWPLLGGNADQRQFSPLAQINDQNATRLGLAWFADLPVADGLVGTPLVMDGTVYQGAPGGQILANDVRTGKLLWNFKPAVGDLTKLSFTALWANHFNRGVAIDRDHAYIASGDCRLFAVDRRTGKQVWESMACDPTKDYGIVAAPRVGGGMVFTGNTNTELGTARGHVNAFDAATGKHLWRFYMMPGDPAAGFENAAMEMASKTWGKEYWKLTVGAAAPWEGITYDEKLKRIYVGGGNPSPGDPAKRAPGNGDELFSNTLVALDAKTGKYLWHYVTTPQDGNADATGHVMIADLPVDGSIRRVVMLAAKNTFFYVLDAKTGKFLSADKFVPNSRLSHVDPASGRMVLAKTSDQASAEWRHGGGHPPWALMAYNPASGLVYIPGFATSRKVGKGGGDSQPPPEYKSEGRLVAWDPIAQKERWHASRPHTTNGGVLTTAGKLVFQGTANGTFEAFAADTGKLLWSFDAKGAVLGAPTTVEIDGEQIILVPSGDGGATATGQVASGSPGATWAQSRPRLLAFKLNGTAVLSPNPPAAEFAKPFLPRQPEALATKGAELFYSIGCYACHGYSAEKAGLNPTIPDLRRMTPTTYQAMSAIVIGGARRARGMPDWSKVTEEELEAIKALVINNAWKAYDEQQARAQGTPVTGIRSLGPFGISVTDLDRSARFYAALGFKAAEKTELPHSAAKVLGADQPDSKATMQSLGRDGAEVLLLQLDPRPTGPAADRAAKQLGLAHIELMVDDVDQVSAEIARSGGTVLSDTRTRLTDVGPNPLDIVFCRDPDGTLIVLVGDNDPATKPALGPFGISVTDLDRSARFYAALGFKAGDKTELPHSAAKVLGADQPDSKATMQSLGRDGAEVLLLQLDPLPSGVAADRAAKQFGLAHIELMVDDVDQVASEIARLGGTVLSETRSRLTDVGPNPLDIVFCRDPDGTLIVLVADNEAAGKPDTG